ncbi:MAG: SufD family Fe-S cluster assembly protein [Acidimicrobiaceae bacterium]|nr:SufD family Fe-S cluster assembly protein [Acidimicrobiaceae bacterium]
MGSGSRIALIQTYCGLDGRAVTNASTTIRVGRHAEVDHCRVQTESTAATHVGHTRIEQEEGSRLRMTSRHARRRHRPQRDRRPPCTDPTPRPNSSAST